MKTFMFWLLIAVVFGSAMGTVISRHQARKLFVETQALEKTRAELQEEWSRLLLEQSTWATDIRIETTARSRLEMMEPVPRFMQVQSQ